MVDRIDRIQKIKSFFSCAETPGKRVVFIHEGTRIRKGMTKGVERLSTKGYEWERKAVDIIDIIK
jgi:hypothetical protein